MFGGRAMQNEDEPRHLPVRYALLLGEQPVRQGVPGAGAPRTAAKEAKGGR